MIYATLSNSILLLFLASQAQDERSEVSPLPRAAHHGVAPALHAKLALLDARDDTWPTERWNALVSSRFGIVMRAWDAGRVGDLATLAWVDPSLAAPPLLPSKPEDIASPQGWRISRGSVESDAIGNGAAALAQTLATWRNGFQANARLDLVVDNVRVVDGTLVTGVRVQASGHGDAGRLQHNAYWTCQWREGDDGVVLLKLAVDTFEAITLEDASHGWFEDASGAVFGVGPLAEQLGQGLAYWRATIPSDVDPGLLGHQGLAIGDVDGDGLEDLYLCQPGGLPNKLLIHKAWGVVQDVSAAAGVDILDYSSSALLVDLDGDGDLDLAVSTAAGLVLYANDGHARFENKYTLKMSIPTSLAAADPDGDGDLDLYVCSYLSPYGNEGLPMPYHDANNGMPNVFLRNEGGWTFADATVEVGLDAGNRRFSFAAAWEDYDDDGDQDLYVANDFGRNNLYRNDEGRFVDVAPTLGVEDVAAGMGVTWGDVDGDGRMDLYVTNMHSPSGARLTGGGEYGKESAVSEAYRHHAMGNTLLLNRGDAGFENVSERSGTAMGRWGWGGLFLDLDNDGNLDLVSPNGFVTGSLLGDLCSFFWRQVVLQSPAASDGPSESYQRGWGAIGKLVRKGYSWNGHERNVAFLNLGGGSFVDVSNAAGLDHIDDSRAVARVDWDGDGDQDLFVTNRTGPRVRFLVNRGQPAQGWIAFRLNGKQCNRSAIGARVTVVTDSGRRLSRSLRCGEGFLAQSSSYVHFGLGEEKVETLEVRWPGGDVEAFGAPERGARYMLEQGSGQARALSMPMPKTMPILAGGEIEVPKWKGSTRTVLTAPLPLPRLALESRDGRPAAFLGIDQNGPSGTGRPLLVILWGIRHPSSLRVLTKLVEQSKVLRAAGFQILAVSIDKGEDRTLALEQLDRIGWGFSRGFATDQAVDLLEVFQTTLHDSAESIVMPTSVLIDPNGWLLAMYRGQLDSGTLKADLGLIGLPPGARRNAAAPFTGRWLTPTPTANLRAFESLFAARGLQHAAAEYHLAGVDLQEASPASFHHKTGQARLKQGRYDLAIQHFEQAHELDPLYFPAALSLAEAYHHQQQYEPALKMYLKAVRLDPNHGQTRLNLGLLHLAMGNKKGARAQLAALRALKSEHTEALAKWLDQ
ncbi:MAG: tetratricopeptide repeat protein [bacterium]|nr:tetratricopeptide repeat protein [bacterium]